MIPLLTSFDHVSFALSSPFLLRFFEISDIDSVSHHAQTCTGARRAEDFNLAVPGAKESTSFARATRTGNQPQEYLLSTNRNWKGQNSLEGGEKGLPVLFHTVPARLCQRSAFL